MTGPIFNVKRVLVTGASGFIGRQTLAPLLRLGYEVHAVSNLHAIDSITDVIWHKANFLDRSHRQRLLDDIQPSHILHLAWYVEHGKFWMAPENKEWSEATIAFAQSAANSGVTRVVLAGSSAEYEWPATSKTPLDESTSPLNPSSPYGTEKLRAWHSLWNTYGDTPISLATGRIFMLYGPHENPQRFIPSVIRSLMIRRPFRVSTPYAYRDFLDSRDAGKALAMLLDSPVEGPVNIASGKTVTLADVSRLIASLMDRENLLVFGEPTSAQNATNYVVANTARLINEVKSQQSISLESGVRNAISCWKQGENHQ